MMKSSLNPIRLREIQPSLRSFAAKVILFLFLLWGACGAFAQTISGTPAATYFRPGFQEANNFGSRVAAVGEGMVVMGANVEEGPVAGIYSGAAYLFDANGVLLRTFTNPTPAEFDSFGGAVAGVGSDKVIIAAWNDGTAAFGAGAAYLFSTDGTLLKTFLDPHPGGEDSFGFSVAGVGPDKVIIGAHDDDTGAQDAGFAYLFSTSGTLLKSFPNPAPALNDNFGSAVAAVGTDRVLIGARFDGPGAVRPGVVYLFHIDGTLLKTFNSPVQRTGEVFGDGLAAVGTDRVLIGASENNGVNVDAGVAYLFSTDGTLLRTFKNPTPIRGDSFGYTVQAVGRDRVLIGATYSNAGASASGAAYLFTTGGTLLKTFTDPAPLAYGNFGISLTTLGTDRVLVGSGSGPPETPRGGIVYRFDLPPPPLDIALSGASVIVSWPAGEVGYQLQQGTALSPANAWSAAPGETLTSGNRVSATIPVAGDRLFFRLKAR